MTKTVKYQGIDINYTIDGEGDVLLFLHGYLESLEIWKDFVGRFTGRYRVICVDIPGHGRSDLLGAVHEMDEMARVVASVLDSEDIKEVVVVGHSMGGYVAMEFVHLFPERTKGYCLFHSTCFADSREKQENRDREISLVLCGKKLQIIRTNIPKGFAEENIEKMADAVEKAKQIASGSPDEGIIALLRGMKERRDHSELLGRRTPPPLIIWGRKDNYIGEEVFNKLIDLAPHATVVVLKNSGHMGFIEEPECSYTGMINYLASLK